MAKKIAILGSTGSVGKQALDVIRNHPKQFKVVALSCGKNWQELKKQIKEFKPEAVCVFDLKSAQELKQAVKNKKLKIFSGEKGLTKLACWPSTSIILVAVLGAVGIKPTIEAIKAKKDIALATKEIMVAAGDLVNKEAQKHGVKILPVDSEHSAIFQCLQGDRRERVNKIFLTCSGGSFRGKKLNQLKKVTVKQALTHPNWKMGAKITIDSATLMNKGLEVIEAMKLFSLSLHQIEVIVHPQSIIHSMVEFIDGNILAQLGPSDMRFAICYALSYPKRLVNNFPFLDLLQYSKLTFEKPDIKTFYCLKLAFHAAKKGGTMPAVLNAANEVAVDAFLKAKIDFLSIPRLVEKTILKHRVIKNPNLEEILEADHWARRFAFQEVKNE